ncbi:hypothetical protein CH267_02185 [Rhodococcus sp. 06-621-2]|nr:hypothetical protein [Rhodococcus sp. 06-621-2]OZC62368.1 hypothetical protein CH267_02185 [Rhodococcus sp. 06-621-2]
MEALAGVGGLGEIGAGALVVLVVLLLLSGRLITKAQHDREMAAKDKQIDKLYELLDTEQGISSEVSKQNTALLPGANLATHIAEALHEIADKQVT